jgi:hypothetical protein
MHNTDQTICTYCGADAECKEHVIPVVYFGQKRRYGTNENWVVPACDTCNLLAGSNVFFTIPSKAEYILKRFKQRHAKVLKMPAWTDDELKGLDYKLRKMIFASLVAKRVAQERLEYLTSVTTQPDDFLMPDFIKKQYAVWEKEYVEAIKKLKKIKKTNKSK